MVCRWGRTADPCHYRSAGLRVEIETRVALRFSVDRRRGADPERGPGAVGTAGTGWMTKILV